MSAFHAASLCYVIHYKVLQEMTLSLLLLVVSLLRMHLSWRPKYRAGFKVHLRLLPIVFPQRLRFRFNLLHLHTFLKLQLFFFKEKCCSAMLAIAQFFFCMVKEAYSTPILALDVLAERPPEKKFEWVSNCAIACTF